MVKLFLYFLALFLELIFAISFAVYTISLLFSSIMGSPYVATKKKELYLILEEAHLKKNQIFLELGSGDGRVVRTAVKKYRVKGIGVDINPLLNFLAKNIARLQRLDNITFKTENIFKTNFNNADVIYIFLMPGLIKKLKYKLETQTKKKVLIISHGFKIIGWEKKLIKTIKNKPFPTYFYNL